MQHRGWRAIALLNLLLVLITAATGCGYSHGQRFPANIKSVAVPIFDNRTIYRDVEFDLTEALIKEIELRTPYKVIKTGKADTVLQGTITKVRQDLITRDRVGGLAESLDVTVTINFEWRNQSTGEIIRDRRGFQTTRRHIVTRPVSEPFKVAQHQIVQKTAQDIVGVMQADW